MTAGIFDTAYPLLLLLKTCCNMRSNISFQVFNLDLSYTCIENDMISISEEMTRTDEKGLWFCLTHIFYTSCSSVPRRHCFTLLDFPFLIHWHPDVSVNSPLQSST